VTATSLATSTEVDAALAEAEARLAGYRHGVEELEAEGQDTTRACKLVHGVDAQLALLRERKERLLASEPQSS
jgi:hypothetical protein